jgi:hypothetical protein
MRSISASTCSISCSAWGESAVLLSCVPSKLEPRAAAIAAAEIDRSAGCPFTLDPLREAELKNVRPICHCGRIAGKAMGATNS